MCLIRKKNELQIEEDVIEKRRSYRNQKIDVEHNQNESNGQEHTYFHRTKKTMSATWFGIQEACKCL